VSKPESTADRPEYIECIRSPETGNRLCNRHEIRPPFFQGLDHAYRAVMQGGRQLACKDCVEIAATYMTEGK
jgi:hypothetical protein